MILAKNRMNRTQEQTIVEVNVKQEVCRAEELLEQMDRRDLVVTKTAKNGYQLVERLGRQGDAKKIGVPQQPEILKMLRRLKNRLLQIDGKAAAL